MCAGTEHAESVAGALAALDAFMAALNARDEAGLNAAFNFPHVRIAGSKVAIFEKRGDYKLESLLARTDPGWARSAWDEREVIHASPEKVHFAVRFSRYDAEDRRLASYRSIWVVTRVDGRWGVQARSSFAP